MVQSFVGYCPCGQEIWIEYLRGDGVWICRFFGPDDREATRCPNCGRVLDEDDLESR